MKKSRSGPNSPANMRERVSGSMTVKVADASMDMLTPPCSPNSWRALAKAVAGSSCHEEFVSLVGSFFATKSSLLLLLSSLLGFGLFFEEERTRLVLWIASAIDEKSFD